MPATIESAEQAMAPVLEAIVEGLTPDWRILDFGCGVGRHTRELRAAGYGRTVGVDQPYPGLADDLAALPDRGAHVHIATEDGRLPFDDDTFDLCFSTSVFEHVQDYDQALAEIARVTRPGGLSLHIFPARWRPIESHIYVPLGARFQSYAWYRLWAQLGVRNGFQKDMTPAETARNNTDYAATGLAYPTAREIRAAFGRHFTTVTLAERDYIAATRMVSRVSRKVAPLVGVPGMRQLYRGFHTRVVLAQR